MSETVRYTGKMSLIPKLENETLEEQCKKILKEYDYSKLYSYYDSWEEMLCDKLYGQYVIFDNDIYKIIEKIHKNIDQDIFEAYHNNDGTISYEVMYYNGGCSFDEAISYALEKIDTSRDVANDLEIE